MPNRINDIGVKAPVVSKFHVVIRDEFLEAYAEQVRNRPVRCHSRQGQLWERERERFERVYGGDR